MEPRRRYTRAIDVGIFEDRIGFVLHFDDDQRETFLFDRNTAQRLASGLLDALVQTRIPPSNPPAALGINVGEDVRTQESIG